MALNPATPVETLDLILPQLDFVLIMTVNPGFGGQTFLPYTEAKVRKLRSVCRERGLHPGIEVDGGITAKNVRRILEAGADEIVAGSAVFRGDAEQNVRTFLRLFAEFEKKIRRRKPGKWGWDMERCLIVAGGTMDISFAKKFLEERRYGCVIAADAGLKTLSQLHLKPDAVVGDMDTGGRGAACGLRGGSVRQLCGAPGGKGRDGHGAGPDDGGPPRVPGGGSSGGLGGRMDTRSATSADVPLFPPGHGDLHLRRQEQAVPDRRQPYVLPQNPVRKYVSFLPVTEAVTGLTLRGFKYPLNRCTVLSGGRAVHQQRVKPRGGAHGAGDGRHALCGIGGLIF